MSGFAPAHHVLTFGAAGARGQTAAITALLERHGAYIEEFTVFDDVLSGRFYLRTAFRLVEPGATALAKPGTQLAAMVRGKPVPVEVASTPFVPQRYYRG